MSVINMHRFLRVFIFCSLAAFVVLLSGGVGVEPAAAGEFYKTVPTVAGDGFDMGASLEGRWTYLDAEAEDTVGQRLDASDGSGHYFGLGFWAGKGDFTFLSSAGLGAASTDFKFQSGVTLVTMDQDVDYSELEMKGRYAFPGEGRFVPYVFGGLHYQTESHRSSIVNPGLTFTTTGSSVMDVDRTFISPMIGVGGMYPMTDKYGFIGDASLLWVFGSREVGNAAPGVANDFDGSRPGYMAGLAFYYNLSENVSLDLGVKGKYLDGGSTVGDTGDVGVFARVGYTF